MATATTPAEERVKKARRKISDAQRKAAKIASDPEANRSTRARAALRVKADCLDEVAELLAGR